MTNEPALWYMFSRADWRDSVRAWAFRPSESDKSGGDRLFSHTWMVGGLQGPKDISIGDCMVLFSHLISHRGDYIISWALVSPICTLLIDVRMFALAIAIFCLLDAMRRRHRT